MNKEKEVQDPQNTPEEEASQAMEEPEEIEELPKEDIVSREEFDELKHKAEVSSQNYERAKKAEARVKELEVLQENKISFDEEDEGEDVSALKSEISEIRNKLDKSEVLEEYPQLKAIWNDFEVYQTDNKGMKLQTAAKAFLAEQGLLGVKRKGLEKVVGGTKKPISFGMNTEDITKLRQTNYKKYREMVKKGQIKFS
ncbi:MAG: hypothetical protein KKC03_13125 [Bacteroidetes bacterium]|nr:hypothetical protein [Bacteroidota bacterium]